MRRFLGVLLLLLLVGIVLLLSNPIASKRLPAIGRVLDPLNGCWVSAEPNVKNLNDSFVLGQLHKPVTVWLEQRLVPHISAYNNHDLYFTQGYVHAKLRLWQMDLQTRAAAGRLSEVAGAATLAYDRGQRRKGMVYAAERSLAAMMASEQTKEMLNAYTDGVNAYIASLTPKYYPLEYKLMSFAPEPWTNLKCALLLKYMADDLTGETDDIPLTYLKAHLPPTIFEQLYPLRIPGSATVIPKGTKFSRPSLDPPVEPSAKLVFPTFTTSDFPETNDAGKGSNNWVVGNKKTGSKGAILCNDPHLSLNLPSLWFEVQLQAPGINTYGVSLPGAPGIIIGFNDSLAWGLTNNYRDVKDYYLINKLSSERYKFEDSSLLFDKRVEVVKVKGEKAFVDTVLYTIHGPVQYDDNNPAPGGLRQPLAMCWMGHRGSNELLAVYKLNRATNYAGFVEAVAHFECPAQNFVFADRAGNIAVWGQGQFINKWTDQGRYIMDGSSKAALWGSDIPMGENPHAFNPLQGYLFSANECVTDADYPYWYNGDFVEFRAWRIQQVLDTTTAATLDNMKQLQNDVRSYLAASALPIMLKHLKYPSNPTDQHYLNTLKKWDYNLDARGVAPTVFQLWWHYLYMHTWAHLGNVPDMLYPSHERTLQLLAEADGGRTTLMPYQQLDSLATESWRSALDSMSRAARTGLYWYKVKHTALRHLARIPAFGYPDLEVGGCGNTINAVKGNHGPSWRMVVHMGKSIEAYGVYPGGQSGNPGSPNYGTSVAQWTKGAYNRLCFIPNGPPDAKRPMYYKWNMKNR